MKNKFSNRLTIMLNCFFENKITFFVYVAVALGIVIVLIDYYTCNLYNSEFWENVLVEAHGMWMDIILFGIILTLYERFTDEHKEIKKLHEQIDDYRGWNEPEATYKIVGCIKRLNKKGVTMINLNDCFLEGANLEGVNLRGSNLDCANLKKATLINVNLKYTRLRGANLQESYLTDANLYKADLKKANLRKANLAETNLQEATLNGADLKEAILYKANLKGAVLIEADLKQADLREVNLEGALLQESILEGVLFQGAKILNLEELTIINKIVNKEYKFSIVETGDKPYYIIL